jgi:hypothetical protein
MNAVTSRHPLSVAAVICFGLLLAPAQPLFAQCFNYSYNNYLIAPDPVVGEVLDVEAYSVDMEGDLAYVACWGIGLAVVDVRDRAAPKVLGTVDVPRLYEDVAVMDGYAYMKDSSGFDVVDVSDPSSPRFVTSVTGGCSRLVAVDGFLYVANSYYLDIYDVANPGTPVRVSHLYFDGPFVADVAIADNIACVAGSTSLFTVDITNPALPVIVGTANVGSGALAVAVAGDRAYVAKNTYGLSIVNISTPTAPVVVGTVDTPGYARDVAVSGNFAFVADYSSGLHIVDVTKPTSPRIVEQVAGLGAIRSVATDGDFAYVTDFSRGLVLVNVRNPIGLAPEAHGADIPGRAFGLACADGLAYVADYGAGLRVLDLADPEAPLTVGSATTPGSAIGVTLVGTSAYLCASTQFVICDVANPAAPAVVGSAATPNGASAVAIAGNLAHVAGYVGFGIYDIADPAAPAPLGSIHATQDAWGNGIALAGEYAFVVGGGGLKVINVVDPQNPVVVTTLPTGGTGNAIALRDGYAFIATDLAGLVVVDVSVPASPAIVAGVAVLGQAAGISLAGNVAYLAAFDRGVQVVDISDPLNPVYVGGGATAGIARDIIAVDGRLLVACDGSGLQVLPQDCGFGDDCSDNGLADLVELTLRPSLDWNNDGIIDNCQQGWGAAATPEPTHGRLAVYPAHPNPSNPGTMITFELAQAGRVDVRIYDIAGRRVRTLVANGSFPEGRGSVYWNGRDDADTPVGSGVYLFEVVSGGESATRRMVLLK